MRTTPTPLKLAVAAAAAMAVGALVAPPAQALLTSGSTVTGLSDATVIALYEEERLAGDVYDQLADDTGAQIFSNIAESEDRHKAAVATLLETRGINVDQLPSSPGTYQTDGYDALYDRLVTDGQKSLTDAYQVGVEIETTDLEDLQRLLDQTTDPAEVQVLTDLLNGSENHLEAFESALAGTAVQASPGAGRNSSGYRGGNGPGAQHGMGHQFADGSHRNLGSGGPGPKSATPGECDGSGRASTGQ